MSELTKERIQQVWDYELISAWDEKGKNKFWMVVKNFICRVSPEKEVNYFDAGASQTIDFLSSLGLKRCLDVNHKTGMDCTWALKSDVIGFIHGRCESLSMDLINEVPKPLILLDINKYKWIKRDVNHNNSTTSKRRHEKLKDKANLKIKARSLSGGWDTFS